MNKENVIIFRSYLRIDFSPLPLTVLLLFPLPRLESIAAFAAAYALLTSPV